MKQHDFNPHVSMNFFGKKKFDFLTWLSCHGCKGMDILIKLDRKVKK